MSTAPTIIHNEIKSSDQCHRSASVTIMKTKAHCCIDDLIISCLLSNQASLSISVHYILNYACFLLLDAVSRRDFCTSEEVTEVTLIAEDRWAVFDLNMICGHISQFMEQVYYTSPYRIHFLNIMTPAIIQGVYHQEYNRTDLSRINCQYAESGFFVIQGDMWE